MLVKRWWNRVRSRLALATIQELTCAQGFATIDCTWDATGDYLSFTVNVSWERDGLVCSKKHVSKDKAIEILSSILNQHG